MACNMTPIIIAISNWISGGDGKVRGNDPSGLLGYGEPEGAVYVSTTGNDTTGDGSIGNPWRTPEFGAKQLTQPGDTLVITGGTYVLDAANLPVGHTTLDRFRALVSPPFNVSGTLANPITIKAANGDTVFLDGGVSPQWTTVGTCYGDYTVIDGIQSRGCAMVGWTIGSVVKNCDLYGGIDTPVSNGGDNFGCVIRVEGATDCSIINSKLRDNQLGATIENSPLLIEYDTTNLVIDRCSVYGSVGMGIRFKDNPETIEVKNCFIYNNTLSGIQSNNQDLGHNISIHNNVIINNNSGAASEYGGIVGNVLMEGWSIYNNTFYGNGYTDIAMRWDSSNDYSMWNNIHSRSSSFFYRSGATDSTGAAMASVVTLSDYNNFYGAASFKSVGTTYANLAAFTAALGYDVNSVTINPNFINAGGTTAADYKRSSYPANGRGGAYAAVMGAYVTGSEQIGVNW